MALVACGECGNQISTSAQACPKCGAVQATAPRTNVGGVLALILIPLAGLVAAFLIYGASIPEYQNHARKVREACYKLASYDQRYICDQQYRDAIAKGQAESAAKK